MSQKIFTYKGVTIDIDNPKDNSIFRQIPLEKVDRSWRRQQWRYQLHRFRLASLLSEDGINEYAKEIFAELHRIESDVKNGHISPRDPADEERKAQKEYEKAVFGSVQS